MIFCCLFQKMPSRPKTNFRLYKRHRPKKRHLLSPQSVEKKRFKSYRKSPMVRSPVAIVFSRNKTTNSPFKKIDSPMITDTVSVRKLPKSPFSNTSNIGSPFRKTPTKRSSRKKLNFVDSPSETGNDFHHTNIQTEIDEITTSLHNLVSEGKFSLDNIGYKIFKDTLKWHSSGNTSGMRFSQETKEFFWTGETITGRPVFTIHERICSQRMLETEPNGKRVIYTRR